VRKKVQHRDGNEITMLIDIWSGLDTVVEKQSALMAYCGKKGLDMYFMIYISQHCLNGFIQTVLSYMKDVFEEFRVFFS
jgi:hypothetical protein